MVHQINRDEMNFFRTMSSSVLFDLLAGDHIDSCDHSDVRAARTILKERSYTQVQVDEKIRQHEKRWFPKTYYFVSLFRWVAVLSSIPMLVINYHYRNIHIVSEVFVGAPILAILLCVEISKKYYRGSRYYLYQGFPAPISFIEICTSYDFFFPPLIAMLNAVINFFVIINFIFFIYFMFALI
jgi:hypothetical protein